MELSKLLQLKPLAAAVRVSLLLLALGLSPAQAKAQTPLQPSGGFATGFTLTNDHIVISAILNGQGPYSFLVDTGANANILLGSVAKQLGVPLGVPTTVNGFGAANTDAQQTQPVTIAINGAPQSDQSFLILDSALQIAKTAQPLHGILGLPLLQHQVIFLDFANQGIAAFSPLVPRSKWPSFAAQQSVHFTIDDTGIALIPMTINGVAGNFQLDTGSNATVIVYSEFATAHPDAFPHSAVAPTSGNPQIGGSVQMSVLDHAALAVGNLTGIVAPIYVSGSTPPSAQGKNIAGNVGVGFLKQFEMLIDYPDTVLTLTPSPRSTFFHSAAALIPSAIR